MAVGLLLLGLSGQVSGQEPAAKSIEAFEASLGYQTGTVTLSDGMVTIRLPELFRFLGPDGSRRLLTEAWGNPADSADGVLGMLIPSDQSPVGEDGWGILITYDEDGFVDDEDGSGIDYGKMLAELQAATSAANEERQNAGFEPVRLVGWAEPPSYDRATHKMYWARELAFGQSDEHTLNYAIRVLGRRGVLVLNAVASIDQLDTIRSETKRVMAAVEFNEGHRYTDYLPGKDRAASYGIAGLILGATATKAGLFKVLLASLLAFKKGIVLAVIALGALIKTLFTKKTTVHATPPPLPR